MKIRMIGRYQLSQSRVPLAEARTASTPKIAQRRNTTDQTEDSTRLMRLNAGECQSLGGVDSFA
jgi:hypothetical protein